MNKEVTEILVERVKERLKQLDKSQEWLGEQTGRSGAGVRKALSEARKIRLDTLSAWAKALEVSVDWLLGVDSPAEARLACIAAIVSAPASALAGIKICIDANIKLAAAPDNGKSAAPRS